MPGSHQDADLTPVIGVGASAGGVEPLVTLVSGLPAAFPAAIIVVMHLAPAGPSVLADILGRATAMRVVSATDGAVLEPGTVYVARPNEHLLVEGDHLRSEHGPRVNGHRPAIDPTLESLVEARGAAATAVILSGSLDDGSHGAARVKAAGGVVLVQDPDEARHSGMIASTQRIVDVDGVYPAAGLATALLEVVRRERSSAGPDPTQHADDAPGATRYTCPDCGGVLWRHGDGDATRFACSVGHEYGPATLGIEQARDVEAALWAAVRILGDREALLTEMATLADGDRRPLGAQRFRDGAHEVEHAAAAIRAVVETGDWTMTDDPASLR